MDLVFAGGRSSTPSLQNKFSFPFICANSFIPHCFLSFHSQTQPSLYSLKLSCHAKKKKSRSNKDSTAIIHNELLEENPIVAAFEQRDAVEEEFVDEEVVMEDEFLDDFGDDIEMDDGKDLDDDFEDFDDGFEDEEANLYVGDGAAGGGISLAGTWWDKEALAIAEEVSVSFGSELKIYAFKTSSNSTIRVRIENISTKYGSPSMDDIEAYSTAYRSCLDEAEQAGSIPDNITLEVSSPGLERVVRIPEELERFKDKPMYVKYANISSTATSPQESDGIFKLISYDMELQECTWGIADVKVNRQQAGKGRPLSKKQREWRLQTPFESLRLVRLHSDC